MSCETIREALGAYADGEAGPSERAVLEAHLGACAPCRRALAEAAALKASVAALAGTQLPADLAASLRREARAAEARPPLPLARLRAPWAGGLGLALAAAALVLSLDRPAEEAVPLDAMLAAHGRYARSLEAGAEESDEAALLGDLEFFEEVEGYGL